VDQGEKLIVASVVIIPLAFSAVALFVAVRDLLSHKGHPAEAVFFAVCGLVVAAVLGFVTAAILLRLHRNRVKQLRPIKRRV